MTKRETRKALLLGSSAVVAMWAAVPAFAQQQPVQLPPLRVEDDADKTDRNSLNRTPPVATMPSTSIQDTPQAVTVIDAVTMKQQATSTLGEALRNVPGITIAIGEGGTLAGDQFKIRGFDAKDDVYLDGLRDFAAYTRDSFNYQEIQVLKGPSGLMFGRGTTGGAINTVSKTPTLGNHIGGHVEGGNGEHFRTTADGNYQLSDAAAIRVSAMYTNTGVVDRDLTYSRRWGFAPSIALGIGTDTTASLSYIHQHTRSRPDYGLPVAVPAGSVYALPVSEYGVPRSNFLSYSTDLDENDADIVTAKISHVAADWLTISNDARVAVYSRYFQYTTIDRCDTTAATNFCANIVTGANPTAALGGIGGQGPYQQDSWGVQDIISANATFHIGNMKNVFIAGMDASYQNADRTVYAYLLPSATQFAYLLGDHTRARTNIGISLYNPTHNQPPGYTVVLPTPANVANTNTTAAAVVTSTGKATSLAFFATDRLWFTDTLSVIAGVRVDDYHATYSSTTVAGATTTAKSPSTLTNPRASLVYEPSENVTAYFSYGKSSVPQGTSVVGLPTAIAVASQALDPEKSETFDLGAKYSLFNGELGLAGSLFQVNKDNAVQRDPISGDILLQSGQKQRVRGFEISATGALTKDLNILAAYTYLNAVITNDLTCGGTPVVCKPNPYTIGQPIFFVPKHAASIWLDYNLGKFAKGLSVGGGVVYQSKLYNAITTTGTAPNPTGVLRIATIPETIQVDVVASYEFMKHYKVQFNINNLTDRLNYSQSFGNRGTPAPGRTFLVSLDVNF